MMQLAALHQLKEHWQASLRTVVGSSVGGLIGLLLLLGYEPEEIDRRFITPEVMGHFRRDRIIWADALKQLSLFSWSLLEDLLRFACMERLHYVPTLSELVRSTGGKRLITTTWNLTKQRIEYLSAETHPDMCVLQALRMTSAIWFVFPKVTYDGCQYLDGCIGDHTPWRYLVTGQDPGGVDEEELTTLILNLPSPPPPVSNGLLQLMLSSCYVNQQHGEVMAMSMLSPVRTCWMDLVGADLEQDVEFTLSMTAAVHDEQWLVGCEQARVRWGEWLEESRVGVGGGGAVVGGGGGGGAVVGGGGGGVVVGGGGVVVGGVTISSDHLTGSTNGGCGLRRIRPLLDA